ncbi:MAG: hypothetical protein ABI840_11055, partial [bacterium]
MRKLSVLLLTIFMSISVSVFAQPKLTLHLTGGYGTPLGDFKTDVPATTPLAESNRADADYFPYYTKQLVNFGADGKLAFGKKG